MWKYLRLPNPTPVQYDIAYYLQHGEQRTIIQAFRGVGKSYITSAYAIWLLYWNPDIKILVVSSGRDRAEAFTQFVLQVITDWEVVSHLTPRADQRRSLAKFDVNGAQADHSPSIKSIGITGQMVGSRADVIIPDDVESPKNSLTQTQREKLENLVKEFDAILKPGTGSKIRYLGTPQVHDSLYGILDAKRQKDGSKLYYTRIWPARIPSDPSRYKGNLAPMIQELIDSGVSPRTPTDPQRFDEEDLIKPEASYGRSGFALQFMLDTSLDDGVKFPLKCSDLIVMDTDKDIAPVKVSYGSSKAELMEIECVGMNGDRWYEPRYISEESIEYTDSVMFIDPSGTGTDNTSFAVVKYLNGYLYLTRFGGFRGGHDHTTLLALARVAKEQQVNRVIIESNFGNGMYTKLFQPVLFREYRCAVEEVSVHTQKELRIIDSLEPVMNQHRLVVNKDMIIADMKKEPNRQLFYQMTRLTRERGSLVHDDELDALAGAVNYYVNHMGIDVEETEDRHKQEMIDADLDKWMEGLTGVNSKQPNWMDRV